MTSAQSLTPALCSLAKLLVAELLGNNCSEIVCIIESIPIYYLKVAVDRIGQLKLEHSYRFVAIWWLGQTGFYLDLSRNAQENRL